MILEAAMKNIDDRIEAVDCDSTDFQIRRVLPIYCSGCSLDGIISDDWKVFGDGNPAAKVAVVGRNPSMHLVKGGRESCSLYDEYFDILGIRKQDVYVTDACFCASPVSVEYPRGVFSTCASNNKGAEFASLMPTLECVFLFGQDAFQNFFGDKESIFEHYGITLRALFLDKPLLFFPMLHPGFVLRNLRTLDLVKHHLETIRARWGKIWENGNG